jgi:hypothetical protein
LEIFFNFWGAALPPTHHCPYCQRSFYPSPYQAQVFFAGLAPGFPGLYQVNVIVPADLSPGTQPISVTVGGKTSKAVNIAVQWDWIVVAAAREALRRPRVEVRFYCHLIRLGRQDVR